MAALHHQPGTPSQTRKEAQGTGPNPGINTPPSERDEWQTLIQAAQAMEGEDDLPKRAYQIMITQLRTALALSWERGQKTIQTAATSIAKATKESVRTPTWATIASAGNQPLLHQKPKPAQEAITIRILEKEDQEAVAKMTSQEMVKCIDKPGVVAVNHQTNGTLRIYTNSATAKASLEAQEGWTTKIAQSAKVSKKQYTILLHDMPTEFDPTDPRQIKRLQDDNPQIPKLHITKTTWLHRKRIQRKKTSALILWVQDPTTADAAIEQGLIWQYSLKTAERHSSQFRIMQCFRCQQYGHHTYSCTSPTQCSKCTGHHTSSHCDSNKERCVNCSGHHPSYHPNCPQRKLAKEKAIRCRMSTPRFFQEDRTLPLTTHQRPAAGGGGLKRMRTGSQGGPLDHVTNRGPGRPKYTEIAGRDSAQGKIQFQSTGRTPNTTQQEPDEMDTTDQPAGGEPSQDNNSRLNE